MRSIPIFRGRSAGSTGSLQQKVDIAGGGVHSWDGDIAPVGDEVGLYFVDYLVDIFDGEGKWFVGVECG